MKLEEGSQPELALEAIGKSLIVQGLTSSPRSLPSLLLWDAVGLRLYEQIMSSPDYYPTRIEAELLRANVDAIVEAIGNDGVILELGSGYVYGTVTNACLSKTSIILDGFAQKHMHVTYCALDVCASSLADGIRYLRNHLNHSPYVSCHPLCMTYHDGISWMANQTSLGGKMVTVLWLGSSLANESPHEFRSLLNGFSAAFKANSRLAGIQFLAAVDGNKDSTLVTRAYDTRDGLSSRFVLNILNNINRVLGTDAFNAAKWAFDGTWDDQEAIYQTCIRSLENQEMTVGGEQLKISEGEKIRVIASRKLDKEQFATWLAGTSLLIAGEWKHSEIDYGLYKLVPAPIATQLSGRESLIHHNLN